MKWGRNLPTGHRAPRQRLPGRYRRLVGDVTPYPLTLTEASSSRSPAAVDPQVYLRGGSDVMTLHGAVAYDMVDFINLGPPVVEEVIISEHGSLQIIHRTAARKPKNGGICRGMVPGKYQHYGSPSSQVSANAERLYGPYNENV